MTKEDLMNGIIALRDAKIAAASAEISSQYQQVLDLVNQLEVGDPALAKELADAKAMLELANEKAKEIDALIPDA